MEEKKTLEIPLANNPEDVLEQFSILIEIVRILRKECPWDKAQTHESISQLIIEEAYEVIDALEQKNDNDFAEELGDVLLHIVMHGVLAEERGAFTIIDIINKIQEKLIRRHPHVFGDTVVHGQKDVLRNWENIKMNEGKNSLLEGVPKILPALLRAQRLQFKASKVGFDWVNRTGVWDKLEEELLEYKKEIDDKNYAKASEELGDLLFAVVNVSRFDEIVAEEALQKANNKFTRRFQYIENKAKQMSKLLSDMTLEEMDLFWDEAKALEKINID